MSEPQTAAGRRHHDEAFGFGTCIATDNCPMVQSIRAIEDEAALKERERIAALIEALPDPGDIGGYESGWHNARAEALAAITDTGDGR